MRTLASGPVGGVVPSESSLGDANAAGQIKVVADHPEYGTKWCVYKSSSSGVLRRDALTPGQTETPPLNPVTIPVEERRYVLLEANPGVSFYDGSHLIPVDVRKNVKTKIRVTYFTN